MFVGGGLIFIGAGISASLLLSLTGPVTPVGTSICGALAEKGLVPNRGARSWRAGGLGADTTRGCAGAVRLVAHQPSPELAVQQEHAPPPQLPASAARLGFRSFHCAARGSSFRLKARLPRSFHRARQQPTPRGAASAAHLPPPRGIRRTAQRRAAASESIRRAAHRCPPAHILLDVVLVPRRPAPVRVNPRPACAIAPSPSPTWQ